MKKMVKFFLKFFGKFINLSLNERIVNILISKKIFDLNKIKKSLKFEPKKFI